jgi:23S rRNA pseudouridine2605 synthase
VTRERLQKVIAGSGLASRRAAEDLIRAGRVTLDGRTAILGEQADPDTELVLVDGKPLPASDGPRVYWAVNKPAGYVSTVRDRHAERTVMDLLPPKARREARLYPVGRLDEDSEGLLLFTNDGNWANLLLHPRYEVEREYMVGLERAVTREQRAALRNGIELEEGTARIEFLEDSTPGQVESLREVTQPPHPSLRWYRVVLEQGWKRQIRRMFDAVDAPVRRLVRVRVGTLKLTDIKPGEARPLRRQEVSQLASSARAADAASKPGAAPTAPDGRPATAGRDILPDVPRTHSLASIRPLVVALDGPSSSGKSTVGAEAARRLGFRFCDTGLLYRAVAWLAVERGVPASDVAAVVELVAQVQLVADSRGRLKHVQADGRDVTMEVREPAVDRAVSEYSKVPEVRAALVPRQRALAATGGIIMAGRDIGTVILPDADIKIYLYASPEERARRRTSQRRLDARDPEAAAILEDLRRRDAIDTGRETAPLKQASDAVVLTTDGNTFEQTVSAVVDAVRAAQSAAGGARGR